MKELVVFGTGKRAENIIKNKIEMLNNISFFLDNDFKKNGTFFFGKEIKHPSNIRDWEKYNIFILIKKTEEIIRQLKGYGLKQDLDFFIDIPLFNTRQVLNGDYFINTGISLNGLEIEKEFDTIDDYLLIQQNSRAYEFENILWNAYKKNSTFSQMGYWGYCSVCQKESSFTISGAPAFRDTVSCCSCNCNSRVRYIIDRIKHSNISSGSYIYMPEYITPGFKAIKRSFPNTIGSEYLGDDKESGKTYDGILHEDIMKLSFSNDSFDAVVSLDVFEHVVDYKKGFSEILRILKKGGTFFLTVPIHYTVEKTITRTKIVDGKLKYLKEPIYHGDPLSKDGCLVFHDFGMDLKSILLDIGFSSVKYIAYYSAEKAYFGFVPIAVEAIK